MGSAHGHARKQHDSPQPSLTPLGAMLVIGPRGPEAGREEAGKLDLFAWMEQRSSPPDVRVRPRKASKISKRNRLTEGLR